MSENDRGKRVRALREALGMSQETLAKAGGVERVEIVAVEGGKNKVTSGRMQDALARGFALDRDDLIRMLDGEISPEEAHVLAEVNRRKTAGPATPAQAGA